MLIFTNVSVIVYIENFSLFIFAVYFGGVHIPEDSCGS